MPPDGSNLGGSVVGGGLFDELLRASGIGDAGDQGGLRRLPRESGEIPVGNVKQKPPPGAR